MKRESVWSIGDHVLGDVCLVGGRRYIYQWRFTAHFDHALGSTDFKREIQRGKMSDQEFRTFLLDRLKTFRFHRDGVSPGWKIRKPVIAV